MRDETLEQRLRREYEVREEHFAHGAFALDLLLPRAAEELIDVSEFNVDERLPYWADLWPSARALTRLLLDGPPPAGRVLELGCGVALPSLALAWRGAEVLATDYYAEALDFARANAQRNALPALATRLLDWRHPPADLGSFQLVIAADVVYEQRNADALAALLPRVCAPGGRVLLADPGRVYLSNFQGAMESAGWRVTPLPERSEPSAADPSITSRIRLLEFRPG